MIDSWSSLCRVVAYRLFHNFGAVNIIAQLPRVFDDFTGEKRTKDPSHKQEKKEGATLFKMDVSPHRKPVQIR